MRKTYINPTTEVIRIHIRENLMSASEPQVSLNSEKSCNGDDLDVKSSTPSHDVWDDDWSK